MSTEIKPWLVADPPIVQYPYPRCQSQIDRVGDGFQGWAQLPNGVTFESPVCAMRDTALIITAQWANSQGYRL